MKIIWKIRSAPIARITDQKLSIMVSSYCICFLMLFDWWHLNYLNPSKPLGIKRPSFLSPLRVFICIYLLGWENIYDIDLLLRTRRKHSVALTDISDTFQKLNYFIIYEVNWEQVRRYRCRNHSRFLERFVFHVPGLHTFYKTPR